MAIEVMDTEIHWPEMACDAAYGRLNGHEQAWLTSVCKGLRQKPIVLARRNSEGVVDGLLPLSYVKSLLFGRFLVSMPYINTGGPWAADASCAMELVSHACELADQYDVRFLELRLEKPIDHPRLNASRTEKVHMRMHLPPTEEELDRSFKSKLRSQVKKSNEYGLEIEWGRAELLHDFYRIFAINMRDLGTPVFPKQLFDEILKAFPDSAELCLVKKDERAIAAGLLIHRRGVTEIPSASCLRRFNFTGANMWMYRQMLGRAIARGSRVFDFGRSSKDTGTYKFKAQWGAQPYQAHWQYFIRKGSAEDMRPDQAGNKRLIRLWKCLPVWLTRLAGPIIVRGIP